MNKEEKNTILIIEKAVQKKEVFRQNIISLYYTQVFRLGNVCFHFH